jgi:hypothetical protein
MVDVTLTWSELTTAAFIAIRRQIQNLANGRPDRFGAPVEDGWTLHIEGAAGEMAVAKAAGRYWCGSLNDLKADDVGLLQVRTRSRHSYELILHPGDPDDRAFVLVTGRAPAFRIHGWIMGVDGKREEWWADPSGKNRPAYFVPTDSLRDLDELFVKQEDA